MLTQIVRTSQNCFNQVKSGNELLNALQIMPSIVVVFVMVRSACVCLLDGVSLSQLVSPVAREFLLHWTFVDDARAHLAFVQVLNDLRRCAYLILSALLVPARNETALTPSGMSMDDRAEKHRKHTRMIWP